MSLHMRLRPAVLPLGHRTLQIRSRPCSLNRERSVSCQLRLLGHSISVGGLMCKNRETGGMKCGGVSRPYRSMIGARYRAREERRKMLKISAGKLSRIEDPEASLCRSVLINNTLRRLRREGPNQSGSAKSHQPQPEFAEDVPVDPEGLDDSLDAAMFCVPPTPRLLTSIDEDDLSAPANKRAPELSCGQASMLDDSMRFHSLIASLETT